MNASVWRRARVQRNLVDADLTAGLCDVVSRYGLCRITSKIVEAVPDWHDTGRS